MLAQLRKAEASYRAAHDRSEQARRHRNQLLRAALAAGHTLAEISEATGLSRGRISQLSGRRL